MSSKTLEMKLFRCQGCRALYERSTVVCSRCLGDTFIEDVVLGQGLLASWTTVRKPPLAFRDQGPYDVAVIDLSVGLRVTGRILSQSNQQIGDMVSLTHQTEIDETQINVFEVKKS
jgi:uncharacterized OB-fold protein